MALMSKQWLNRGAGLRNKSYTPILVRVQCRVTSGALPDETFTKAELRATQRNYEWQVLHLSQVEVDAIAPSLFLAATPKAREVIIAGALKGLSNAKLLRTLAADLKTRVRLSKSK